MDSSTKYLIGVAICVAAIIGVAIVVLGLQRGDTSRSAAGSGSSTRTENTWLTSLDDAMAEAKQRNTFIVVDFYADWCGWCRKLDKDTISDPSVQERLKEFTLLRIDTDAQPEIGKRYDVSGLPTTMVLDADGKVLASKAGYMQPEQYMRLLDKAR